MERIRIGISGLSSLMRPSAVSPSPSGMRMSSMTTSGSLSKAYLTASAPVATSATTLISVPAKQTLQSAPDHLVVVGDQKLDLVRRHSILPFGKGCLYERALDLARLEMARTVIAGNGSSHS